jgi:hypothetical protein
MKNKFVLYLSILVDSMLVVLIVPAVMVLLLYRRLSPRRLKMSTAILRKMGLFPIRRHYYDPLFDPADLRKPLSEDRFLPGINMNVDGQLAFLSSLKSSQELRSLNLDIKTKDITDFYINNDSFLSGDADFLYQFIRATRPSKVIEIGSGNSTKIARLALERNQSEGDGVARHICIEPYEKSWLEALRGVEVVRNLVENCDIKWESELQAGDLLFVDSSHIIRPQGDVLKAYLEIFPRLARGVYIHIHDIFTPKDYLADWIVRDVRLWNEQYLLEALLTNSDRYEVIAALNYLKHNHGSELSSVCPYLTSDREPGSFYIRVR